MCTRPDRLPTETLRRRISVSVAATATSRATIEPMRIVQRAPNASPTQPMIGDPIGVPPMNTAM